MFIIGYIIDLLLILAVIDSVKLVSQKMYITGSSTLVGFIIL